MWITDLSSSRAWALMISGEDVFVSGNRDLPSVG